MFKKKKHSVYGSVLTENYVPATLPKYGKSIDTFITGTYRLLSDHFIENAYKDCENALSSLIQSSDRFTVGKVCDAYVDGQIAHIDVMHQEDIASHELQAEHIRSALAVRKGILDRQAARLEETREQLKQEIEPLQGLRKQFELSLGRFHLSLGLPITLLAMLVDALLNYSYLNTILLQNVWLLGITVICLSVMSDGSMYALGNLLSRKKEQFMDRNLFLISECGLIAMFVLSVVAGVMIRFGSMDVTYGTINAAGEFVGKSSYSLAEWGISLVTGFLTTATGLISLAFSVDENAHLVDRRRKLEDSLKLADAQYDELMAERDSIDRAADPLIRDAQCRKAAEENLRALRTGLKLHMRKLLADHQGEASYTDSMSQSAEALLSKPAEQACLVEPTADNLSIHKNTKLEEVA